MNERQVLTLLGKIILGLLLGAFFGFLVEGLLFWNGPISVLPHLPLSQRTCWDLKYFSEQYHFLVGPVLGAFLMALIFCKIGSYQFQGVAKKALIGLVMGLAVGGFFVLVGFPVLIMILEKTFGILFEGKFYSIYQQAVLLFGVPLGAFLGLLGGLWYHVWVTWKSSGTPTIPDERQA
jgi:hypothetical protein